MKQDKMKDVVEAIEESVQPITDTVITAKVKGAFVKEKLFGDKPIPVSSVHVETIDGVVYLRGKLKNTAEARRVNQLVKSIAGVREVISALTVNG